MLFASGRPARANRSGRLARLRASFPSMPPCTATFIFIVQRGRLEREAILLVASALRNGRVPPRRLLACYPEPGPMWSADPRPTERTLDYLKSRGVRTRSFVNTDFGERYPHSNKMYALMSCREDFVFFIDTDTFFIRPLPKLSRLSRRKYHLRSGGSTFPNRRSAYEPDAMWEALYAMFGTHGVRPRSRRRVRRYPYYNAGAMGVPDPKRFARVYLDTAIRIESDPPVEIEGQALLPWLDQIALPITLRRLDATVEKIKEGVNFTGTGDHVSLWHYHFLPRLMFEGPDAFGEAVTDVLGDPAVRDVLRDDPIFAYWSGEDGRSRYEAIAADEPVAGRAMVRALKDTVGRKLLR